MKKHFFILFSRFNSAIPLKRDNVCITIVIVAELLAE